MSAFASIACVSWMPSNASGTESGLICGSGAPCRTPAFRTRCQDASMTGRGRGPVARPCAPWRTADVWIGRSWSARSLGSSSNPNAGSAHGYFTIRPPTRIPHRIRTPCVSKQPMSTTVATCCKRSLAQCLCGIAFRTQLLRCLRHTSSLTCESFIGSTTQKN